MSHLIKPNQDNKMHTESPVTEMAAWNDAQLVEACLMGNEQAWQHLLQKYSRLIYTIPFRFGFSQTVADEIFQETCLTLLEQMVTLRDASRLKAWLVTVTRRICIARWHYRQNLVSIDAAEDIEAEADDLEEKILLTEEQYLVQQAMFQLNERCRTLLAALFFEMPPRTYEEISRDFDIALGSIGPTRKRCLESLRIQIAELADSSSARIGQ